MGAGVAVTGGVVGTSSRDVDGSKVEAPEPSGGARVLVTALVAVVGAVVEVPASDRTDNARCQIVAPEIASLHDGDW